MDELETRVYILLIILQKVLLYNVVVDTEVFFERFGGFYVFPNILNFS